LRFLLDENIHPAIALLLADLRHDPAIIGRDFPTALSDPSILLLARQEDRILITNDRDFGELVFRHGLQHSGIVFLRLRTSGLDRIMERIRTVLDDHILDLRQFIVVTQHRVRIRSS
jgi:predicted nuclease of predicted toxin-antitoxin system